MRRQVAIEIARVLKANELDRVIAGVHVHPVAVGQVDGGLTIDAHAGLVVGVNRDPNGGTFGKHDRLIDREMRGHGNQEDVAQLRREDRPPGCQGVSG